MVGTEAEKCRFSEAEKCQTTEGLEYPNGTRLRTVCFCACIRRQVVKREEENLDEFVMEG